MKSSILYFLFLLPGIVFAQKTKTQVETFTIPNSKEVKLNLKFAQSIKVTEWSKNEIELSTIFTYSEEDFLDRYDQEIDKSNGILSIETGLKNMKNNKQDNTCWGCEDEGCYCLNFAYEIKAPRNVILALETISGDIEIKEWNTGIKAKTISGYVDLGISASAKRNLSLKSVTGEVFTDLDVRLDKNSSAYSKRMNTQINGGGALVKLETVSGDIYLRKK